MPHSYLYNIKIQINTPQSSARHVRGFRYIPSTSVQHIYSFYSQEGAYRVSLFLLVPLLLLPLVLLNDAECFTDCKWHKWIETAMWFWYLVRFTWPEWPSGRNHIAILESRRAAWISRCSYVDTDRCIPNYTEGLACSCPNVCRATCWPHSRTLFKGARSRLETATCP